MGRKVSNGKCTEGGGTIRGARGVTGGPCSVEVARGFRVRGGVEAVRVSWGLATA